MVCGKMLQKCGVWLKTVVEHPFHSLTRDRASGYGVDAGFTFGSLAGF